jgi:hypothetical protein
MIFITPASHPFYHHRIIIRLMRTPAIYPQSQQWLLAVTLLLDEWSYRKEFRLSIHS